MLTRNISSKISKMSLLDNWEALTIFSEEYSCKREDMAWQTLRAVCKREGWFVNSNAIHFNWREAMMELVLKPVNRPWAKSFGEELEKYHCKLQNEILHTFDSFSMSISELLENTCGKNYAPGNMILQQTQHIGDAFRGVVDTALKEITRTSKECQYEILPVIAESMLKAYQSAAAESGKFSHLRRVPQIFCVGVY
jgi:hypothetical protein